MAKKRIGILTGGGNVAGLNAAIKTITYRSSENDIEVVGLRRGWEALTHLNLEDPTSRRRYIISLDRENTRTIDRRGGTVLHTSRTNPSKMQKLPDHLAGEDFPVSLSNKGGIASKTWDVSRQVLANLSVLGIEHLIAIGGDDTFSYAAKLDKLGVKIIAIPKTIDNNVRNTEYCIGFSTAITRAADAISASAPPSARTSGSAFSASSAATPGLQRSTPRTSPRSAVSSPNTRSISTSSFSCSSRRSTQTRATTRWSCSARAPSGTATRCSNTAKLTHTATVEKEQAWPSRLPTRSSGAPARRRSRPTSLTTCARATRTSSTACGLDLWQHGVRRHPGGQDRPYVGAGGKAA